MRMAKEGRFVFDSSREGLACRPEYGLTDDLEL